MIEYRNVTDGQTDRQTDIQTDIIAVSLTRVIMLTRDKSWLCFRWPANLLF